MAAGTDALQRWLLEEPECELELVSSDSARERRWPVVPERPCSPPSPDDGAAPETVSAASGSTDGLAADPDDLRWRAWLAERGHDVVVHDGNVHRYARMRRPAESVAPPAPRAPEEDPWDAIQAPPPGMGAKGEKHAWTQTVQWVELCVPLPHGTRARDLLVGIGKTRVRVQLKGAPSALLNAELARPVYVGDGAGEAGSSWELIDRRLLALHLNKWHSRERANCRDATETWWPACFADEPPCAARPPVEYYATRESEGWHLDGGIKFAG